MLPITDHIFALPDSNELHYESNGKSEIFQLEPLTMKVLTHLLKHKGKVCSSNELIDTIWDGNRGVGGSALRKNIYKLRDILSKVGQKDIIETIPKKGYRIKGQYYSSLKTSKWKIYYSIGLILLGLLVLKLIFPGIIHRLLH